MPTEDALRREAEAWAWRHLAECGHFGPESCVTYCYLAGVLAERPRAEQRGKEQMAEAILGPEEERCVGCRGEGCRTYSSTATWSGGIGGQMLTTAVCDKCWGSGQKDQPWADLKALATRMKEQETAAEQRGRVAGLEFAALLICRACRLGFPLKMGTFHMTPEGESQNACEAPEIHAELARLRGEA